VVHMLAFDIETTGLRVGLDVVTVVCACGTVGGRFVERVFNFARDGKEAHADECKALLNAADVLCAVNGLRFDIPFLATYLGLADAETLSWMLKLYDPCEVCASTRVAHVAVAENLRRKCGCCMGGQSHWRKWRPCSTWGAKRRQVCRPLAWPRRVGGASSRHIACKTRG